MGVVDWKGVCVCLVTRRVAAPERNGVRKGSTHQVIGIFLRLWVDEDELELKAEC